MTAGTQEAMLFHALYIVAIVAEAMTAALAAGRRSMDWVGVCLLGCVTALGGGSTRDVLIGHYPLSWVEHPYYLLVTAGAALLTIAMARVMHHLRNIFLVLDAIGLVVFTVIGCNVALDLDLPLLVVITSGMITGCVGGSCATCCATIYRCCFAASSTPASPSSPAPSMSAASLRDFRTIR